MCNYSIFWEGLNAPLIGLCSFSFRHQKKIAEVRPKSAKIVFGLSVLRASTTAGNNLFKGNTDYWCSSDGGKSSKKDKCEWKKNTFPESKTCAGSYQDIYVRHNDPNNNKPRFFCFSALTSAWKVPLGIVCSSNAPESRKPACASTFAPVQLFEKVWGPPRLPGKGQYFWHVVRLLEKSWNPTGKSPECSWNLVDPELCSHANKNSKPAFRLWSTPPPRLQQKRAKHPIIPRRGSQRRARRLINESAHPLEWRGHNSQCWWDQLRDFILQLFDTWRGLKGRKSAHVAEATTFIHFLLLLRWKIASFWSPKAAEQREHVEAPNCAFYSEIGAIYIHTLWCVHGIHAGHAWNGSKARLTSPSAQSIDVEGSQFKQKMQQVVEVAPRYPWAR